MKIALAQINPLIGAFAHNAGKIRARAAEAKKLGCELVIFPELSLSGYPPQDLLERPSFVADHDNTLGRLVNDVSGIGVLCGVIAKSRDVKGKPLHNAAILFENGKILFSVYKRLLPTYDVFDETRYFEPGRQSGLFSYKGLRLGITVCEDIWNDKDVIPSRTYAAEPVADLLAGAAAAGTSLDLLINISASPFHLGKIRLRQEIFTRICTRYKLPLLYVNQVGGQDSLLFDGNSLAMSPVGHIIARAGEFIEDLLVVDLGKGPPPAPAAAPDETAAVYQALVMGVRDYTGKCGFGKAVLGLSGGIDSALTAAVACAALGPANVLGVALPSPFTSRASIEDAARLAENLGCRFEIIPISTLFKTFTDTLAPLFAGRPPDVTEQNIQARIRGNLLMAISNKFGHLLLSTGNKSELAVGYCTLYGDMSGGLAVIADVPKQLVYRLARYVNRQAQVIPACIIDKAPSAELAPNQRDQDDLPPYAILDPIVEAYLEENQSIEEIVRQGYERAVVEDVVRRIKANEYKRKQAPLGLKVTTKAFGHGRRYPIAQNYQEGLD